MLVRAADPPTPHQQLCRAAAGNLEGELSALLESDGHSPPDDPTANRQGWTALHSACDAGAVECVRMLLDAGHPPGKTIHPPTATQFDHTMQQGPASAGEIAARRLARGGDEAGAARCRACVKMVLELAEGMQMLGAERRMEESDGHWRGHERNRARRPVRARDQEILERERARQEHRKNARPVAEITPLHSRVGAEQLLRG